MTNAIEYRNIKHAIVVLKKYKSIFSESGNSRFFKLNKVEYSKNKTILLHFVKKDRVFCMVGETHMSLMLQDKLEMHNLYYKSASSDYPL